MINTLVNRVISVHPDFTYEEVEEVCQDYLDSITEKIKEETKMKRLVKYIEKEFELESTKIEKTSNRIYSLDTIPEYLFNSKAEIVSSLVKITNLTKNIEQTELFEDAEMQINRQDKIALIGKNGAGKTTLLKMIIGRDIEYKGTIEKASGLKIGYLSQDLFWQDTNNTLREEMLMVFPEITEKMNRLNEIEYDDAHWEEADVIKAYLREYDGYRRYELQTEILRYFGFTEEQLNFNVLQLSGGEQTKVQIAKFLITEVDLLILDEPTNHLDIEGIIFLEKFCKVWKKAILSISHDVRFIDNTGDRIVEISGKKLNNYPGGYEKYLVEKQARYDRQLKAHELQKKDIEEQEAWINRFRYTPSKSNSVQSRIKQIDKIERIEKPENESTVRTIIVKTEKRLPEKVMEFKNLEIGYKSPIISMQGEILIRKDDKIGIIGRNGAGKTTLLKTILGELNALSGEIFINPDLIIGSYSQVLADLDGKSTIIAELSKHHPKDSEIRSMLGGLLISGEKVDQTIQTLSGGERAKVALTKMLLTRPHVIIMDEPTNHLDLHSKNVIKHMLENFDGTSLIVSHDRDLLEHISNKVWLIGGGVLRTFNDPEKGFSEVF
ncbi:ABC-F family ATP-binding cassette domain-containing protein [Candidatus Gracilibacteria bacterium]|nr:ABC-F family ATP-binding cassette domain-containing protein [Candidatus Gracilibacteria bacterium]